MSIKLFIVFTAIRALLRLALDNLKRLASPLPHLPIAALRRLQAAASLLHRSKKGQDRQD